MDVRHGNNVLDVRSLREVDEDADHFLVKAKLRIRISSQKNQKTYQIAQWDIEKLQNPTEQQQYEQEQEQKLIENDNRAMDVEDLWN